ncbi:hypothetical protein LRH25_06210 [Ideonella azotifigens]|nr:hypothetical protein [Ideonella azotifigens]MCD2339931.1 hypothetical protein [Ideonella azotifigens]
MKPTESMPAPTQMARAERPAEPQPARLPSGKRSTAPSPSGQTTFRKLFWWRMHHVASVGFRLLTRRWQAAILVLFMVSPKLMPLAQQLEILGTPVLRLTEPGAPATTLGVWLLMLSLAASWCALQAGLLSGGPAWVYLRTLPLPRHLTRRVDLAVLAVADLPLLLPFFAAQYTLHHEAGPAGHARLAATLVLAAQLPLVQLLGLQRSRALLPLLATQALALLAVALGLGSGWLALLLLAASAVALWLPDAVRQRRPRAPLPPPAWLRMDAQQAPRANLLRLDLRFLLAPAQMLRQLGLLTATGLPVLLCWLLPRLGVQAVVVHYVLLMLLVPLLFALAGRAFDLRQLHAPMAALHASQGISPRATMQVGLLVLQLLGLLALLPLALALLYSLGAARALWLLPAGLLALLLLAALNYRGDQGMFIPKVLIAAAASGGLMYALL